MVRLAAPAAEPAGTGRLRRRRHRNGAIASEALYSPCLRYRYRLSRVWADDLPRLLCVLLNPSRATEAGDDPTSGRCVKRAHALGFGGVVLCNLFAWRATRPEDLRGAIDPVGPANDRVLRTAARSRRTGLILCGWGQHGNRGDRAGQVAGTLHGAGPPVCHLGLTRDGAPRHPLYVAMDRAPIPWE